jgi:hypothetical protein
MNGDEFINFVGDDMPFDMTSIRRICRAFDFLTAHNPTYQNLIFFHFTV